MFFRNVIRKIQSEYDQDQWYQSVTDAALYMAMGGFLEQANTLLNELWKHNLLHDRTTWLSDKAFEVLWYAAGSRPEKVPFPQISLDELEIEQRDYLIPSIWVSQFTSSYPFEITDYMKARVFAGLNEGGLPGKNEEEKALPYLIKYLDTIDEQNGYEICNLLAIVTELAAKNGEIDVVVSLLKKWSTRFDRYPYNNASVLIGGNRHVAPLLLQGIIANELKLSFEVCSAFVNDAGKIIDERIRNGPTLVFGKLSWLELVEKLSILALNDEPDLFTDEQKLKRWIGKEPATSEAIIEKEKQLGTQLSDDYKDFLTVSNGFPRFSIIQPELIPIEEINFLKSSSIKAHGSEEIFEIIKGCPGREGEDFGALVESAIALSRLPDESEVWLIPPHSNNMDWECWEFSASNPGERRFKSFRYYIEWHIRFLEEYQ